MQKAGTYFNKIMGFTPATRADAEVTLYPNNKGYLWEVTDNTVCYQYFVAGENPITGAITIPFNGIYGVKEFKGMSIEDTSITVHGKEDKTVEFSIAESDERNFRCFATTSIEAFTNGLNGCVCFAKKGFHLFNQNVYLSMSPDTMTLYSATDVSIMRNQLEIKATNTFVLGLGNDNINAIKNWLNYVNNPKNGTGEILYLSLHRNCLKLQTATCSMILTVSNKPEYVEIIRKLNLLLDYPFERIPTNIDWDVILPATKEKEKEYISIADGQVLRTWSKAFIEFAMLESYEAYKLKTKCNAYMFEMDNGLIKSDVMLMLKS